ncbi:Oidioi.mRNA.OKI2018_I69.PAR.g11563.t1.cds [Oikopleura dioica]|uniref:Oidioi.mRNA.OKI2018_I69.PAR.g11563.t1.cds n=1 Tax=Oikopleura dioica TaxID=34765 RepID=A0ABN7S2M4_OIKDI|nr:Oidioi.mRNA.OKI2018_I69.PAR.g11563.t1.cds [Oikopleura dioica]
MNNKENVSTEKNDWIDRIKDVERQKKCFKDKQDVFQEIMFEFLRSKTIDKNDKDMLTFFTDRIRYISAPKKFYELMCSNDIFTECARFWILWSLLSDDTHFWSKENNITSLGTAHEDQKIVKMYQEKKITSFTGEEISSIEELKAKKWADQREANALQLKIAELENQLIRKNQQERQSLPSPTVPPPQNDRPKQADSLLSKDSFNIETPAIPKIHETCSGGGFTENLSQPINLPSQESIQKRLEQPSSSTEFTQPTISDASSLLTPLQKKPKQKLEIFQEEDTLVFNSQAPQATQEISQALSCLTPVQKPNRNPIQIFETTGTEALTPVSKPIPKPFADDSSIDLGPKTLDKTKGTQPMTTPINLRQGKNIGLTPQQQNPQMSGFTEQLRTDCPSLSFTPTRQGEEFKKPTQTFNLEKTPERSDALKRDSRHLTPLGNRFRPEQPTSVGSDTRPPITPTGIVNNVNEMVNNFFAPTMALTPNNKRRSVKIQRKQSTNDFMNMFTNPLGGTTTDDDTPEPERLPAVQKKKISVPKFDDDTLAIMNSPGVNQNAAAMLEAFDQSLNKTEGVMSETQRIKSEQEMTFGFAKVDPTIIMFAGKTTDFNSMKTGVFEPPSASTRCVRLSRSVAEAKGPLNPWSKQFVDMQMDEMDIAIDSKESKFLPKMPVHVQGHEFKHQEMVGEGNFAKVYRYESATGGDVAVKVQKESEPWEYAILAEVQDLLKGTPAEESILKLIHFTKYPNCGVMVTPYYVNGTLLSLCGQAKPLLSTRAVSMKPFILFFAAQLTALLVELHGKDIIHGDFKPDNVMLLPIDDFESAFGENKNIQGVCLIDWGRSINCGVYSGAFKGKCYTSGFMCAQMVKNEPWRFQVDLYALAMSLYIVMFGDYANVDHDPILTKSKLSTLTIPRHFDRRVWPEIFNSLMNYDSLENPVDLLQEKRDYFANEYNALSPREKENFKDHYLRHLENSA